MLDVTQLAPLDIGPGQDRAAYDGAIDALLRDTARNLMVASGLFWLIATLLTTVNWGGDRLPGLLAVPACRHRAVPACLPVEPAQLPRAPWSLGWRACCLPSLAAPGCSAIQTLS